MSARRSTRGAAKTLLIVACALGAFIVLTLVFDPFHIWYYYPAKSTQTLSNVKQIGMATIMYTEDFDGRFPHEFSTYSLQKEALMPYLNNEKVFETLNPAGGEIVPNANLQQEFIEGVVNPAKSVMHYETKDWEDKKGRNLDYVDSHAKFIKGFDESKDLDVEFVYEETPLMYPPSPLLGDWYSRDTEGREVAHLILLEDQTFSYSSILGESIGTWKIVIGKLLLTELREDGSILVHSYSGAQQATELSPSGIADDGFNYALER